MQVKDILYGSVEITEAVLIELLNAPKLLRLKHITQAGVPQKYNSLKVYDRYQHSVGVMILLRKFGANLEEQVAGLLHDVSHLAFSHVAEWVFQENGSAIEGFNESLTRKFIEESEIKEILEKYKFNVEKISDLHSFDLLKREMPDINADRGDYSLREIFKWRKPDDALRILSDEKCKDGQIYFESYEVARLYAYEFFTLQTEFWGGYDAVLRYYLFSQLLRKLVDSQAIKVEDFYGEEDEILEKIENAKNVDIAFELEVLREKDIKKYVGKIGKTIKKKFRYIDPLFWDGSTFLRVSEVDMEFAKKLKEEKDKAMEGMSI